MRSILFTIAAVALLHSCTDGTKKSTETGDIKENAALSSSSEIYTVITEESTVDWIGKKVGKEHEGNITISNGEFYVDGEKITGGEFDLDMNSIVDNDLDDEVMNAKLIGHLKSEDFFEVVTYPNAKFEISRVTRLEKEDEDGNTHKVEGNLTLKAVTKGISFPASIHMDGSSLTASADIIINRADWNVRYGSATHFPDLVADKVISNDIELNISLMAKK